MSLNTVCVCFTSNSPNEKDLAEILSYIVLLSTFQYGKITMKKKNKEYKWKTNTRINCMWNKHGIFW